MDIAPPSPSNRERPVKVLLSFRHNARDSWVTARVRDSYNQFATTELEGVRLIDDPQPGRLFYAKILEKVDASDGALCLWTKEATTSFWVAFELYAVSRFGKVLCLVTDGDQRLPVWWGRREAVQLRGYKSRGPDSEPWTDLGRQTGPNEFEGVFLKGCRNFATSLRHPQPDRFVVAPEPTSSRLTPRPRPDEYREMMEALEVIARRVMSGR